RRESVEVRPATCSTPFVALPGCVDKASPNRKRNDPGKAPWQNQALVAPQKAVPLPAEFLFVAVCRVCSLSLSPENSGPRIVAVRARVSNQAQLSSDYSAYCCQPDFTSDVG